MQFAILKKVIKEADGNVTGMFSVNNKNYILTGNIPTFPNGTTLNIKFDTYAGGNKGYIETYNYTATPRNKKLLENKNVNIENFVENVALHQKIARITWKDIEKVKQNPYKYFNFKKADYYHSITVANDKDRNRLDALVDEAIACNRSRRNATCSLLEYLSILTDVQRDKSSYPLLSESALCMTLNDNERMNIRGIDVEDVEVRDAFTIVKRNIRTRCYDTSSFIPREEVEKVISPKLSNEQKEAVINAVKDRKPVCITGGAGVGKTTVINEIIKAYQHHYADDVLLLAPTGKASRRMASVCNHEAKTIHSALRKMIEDDFVYYNANNPLEQQLIIVDESSMIDILLMKDLLVAISPKAKIVFVGDFNQLYPVGVGEPFHDLIESKSVDVFYLTKNFRQSNDNDILNTANAILDNQLVIKSGKKVEVKHIKADEIVKYAKGLKTQIITPFNKVNDVINNVLRKGESRFNIGDKVIFLKNTKKYCNGDTGIVLDYIKNGLVVQLTDTDEIIDVTGEELAQIDLAYSLTVHKTQGSEYQDVTLFLPNKLSDFIDKRLLYTAVTRAKDSITVYYYEGEV